MTMVSERIYLEIFNFFCVLMVPYVAGRGLNLRDFSWYHFSMQYLPPVGLGRSSESFFHHDSGVRMIQFYEFCNFLRPDGTLGG